MCQRVNDNEEHVLARFGGNGGVRPIVANGGRCGHWSMPLDFERLVWESPVSFNAGQACWCFMLGK